MLNAGPYDECENEDGDGHSDPMLIMTATMAMLMVTMMGVTMIMMTPRPYG